MVRRCLVLTALVACGPVKGNPPAGDAPTGDPGFQLAVLTTNPNVPVDGRAGIELAVTRTGGFDGEITVAGVTPPSGVVIEPLTIAAGEETAELVIGALAPLAIGDAVSFTVEATAGDLTPQQKDFEDVEVTGKPGSLDITWGGAGTGFASLQIGSDGGNFEGVDVLAGKVTATGFGVGGLGPTNFATTRFTATGEIDATFKDPSSMSTTITQSFRTSGSSENSQAVAVGHQFDGRPIIIGYTDSNAGSGVGLVRLATTGANGGNDFGTAGKARLDLGAGIETVNDGLVLEDNRIVAVGDVGGQHVIAMSTSTGSLDTSFATTGLVAETIGTASTAISVAVDDTGRFLVAGITNTANAVDLIITRYTMNGVDDTFGTAGRVTIDRAVNINAVAISKLAGGKILVAAASDDGDGSHYLLFRLDSNGAADTTFGTNGVADVVAPGIPRDMTVLPDGKIMMIGEKDIATLVRFKANGQVDRLFGTDGVVTVGFGDNPIVRCVEVYDANTIVVCGGNVGATPGPGPRSIVARFWF